MFRDVIILTPTQNNEIYWDEWSYWIKQLFPPPRKVVFYEDSSTDGTVERLLNFDLPHEVIQTKHSVKPTKKNRYRRIAKIRQILLDRAKELNPDYAIFIDDDTFIKDSWALDKFTEWGVDIVGGLYLRFFPFGIRLASKWFHPNYPNPKFKMRKKARVLGLDEVAMTSGGCLCLSRRIIQDNRIHFYPMEFKEASEDFGYCLLARKYGYKIYVDGRVKLAHYIKPRRKDWTVDATVNVADELKNTAFKY